MRAFDAYKILDEQEAGSLIDLIAPCICLLYTSDAADEL